jgi:hypothetical protein
MIELILQQLPEELQQVDIYCRYVTSMVYKFPLVA